MGYLKIRQAGGIKAMGNFAIIVVKQDNLYIVVADGEYKDLKKLKPVVEKVNSDTRLISIDKDEYEQLQGDINLCNETLHELWV